MIKLSRYSPHPREARGSYLPLSPSPGKRSLSGIGPLLSPSPWGEGWGEGDIGKVIRNFARVVFLALGCALAGCKSLDPPELPEYRLGERKAFETSMPVENLATNDVPAGALVLSLEKCMELALGGGNFEVRLGSLAPLERAEDIYIAQEAFNSRALLDALYTDEEMRAFSTIMGAEVLQEQEALIEGRVEKKWLSGTKTGMVLTYDRVKDNSEFRTLNPSHISSLKFEVEQPVLNGFGVAVNRAELDQAVNNRQIAEAEFEMVLDSELLGVYVAYWRLVKAAEDVSLEETSLKLANDQVELTRDRFQSGFAADLDVISAQAAEARQSERVITARNLHRKAADELLRRMRPSTELSGYMVELIPSTRPASGDSAPAPVPELQETVRVALANRPELQIETLKLTNAEIELMVARNATYPKLNLVGSFGAAGLGDDIGGSAEETLGFDFPSWSAGVSWGNLIQGQSRQARWRQLWLARESAEIRKQRAVAAVIVDVRNAYRDLETAGERLTATRRTLALAREQYEGELDRHKVGRSTLFQVDTYRRDLLDAERNHARAAIDVYVARAVLMAAQGRFAKDIVADLE